MKKVLSFFACLLTLVIMSVGILACETEKTIDKIELVAGTLKTEYLVGEAVNTSGTKIKVTYSNDTTEIISGAEVVVEKFDTLTVYTKAIKITYKEHFTNVNISVREETAPGDEPLLINGFELPTSLTTYYNNVRATSGANAFRNATEEYYVGTDGVFKLFPKITVLDPEDDFAPSTATSYACDIQVEAWDEELEEFTIIDENIEDFFDDITIDMGLFDFPSDAVGGTYKLIFNLNPNDDFPSGIKPIEFTVKVISGYNAYTVEDLSRMDNSGVTGKPSLWTDYKTEKGIAAYTGEGMVLHNNISLTKENLPSAFFESNGRLKDFVAIFAHNTKADETFSFIGNYFNIDTTAIPFTGIEDLWGNTSLFDFGGDSYGMNASEVHGEQLFKNVSSIGNSNRTADMDNARGLIFFKGGSDDTTIERVNARAYQSMLLPYAHAFAGGDEPIVVKDCRFTDAFTCIVLVWNRGMTIINSELVGSGGPAIISQDSLSSQDDAVNGPLYPRITFDEDSTIFTSATGQEAWFNLNGAAALVGQLQAITAKLTELTLKSATTGGYNMQAILMPDKLDREFAIEGTIFGPDGKGIDMTAIETLVSSMSAQLQGQRPIVITGGDYIGFMDLEGNTFMHISAGVPGLGNGVTTSLVASKSVCIYLPMGAYYLGAMLENLTVIGD